jgi:hypothetical protein
MTITSLFSIIGSYFLTVNWFSLLTISYSIVFIYYIFYALKIRTNPIAPINYGNICSIIFGVIFVFLGKFIFDVTGLTQ